MTNNLTIETENVGGLIGKNTFHFKKGINTVRAPNALGKTSLLHAIELLGLRKQDLSGKGYYSNLFTNGSVVIKTSGSIETERRFTSTGDNLQLSTGNPIIKTDKDNISSICFVTSDNPLIDMLLSGKSIKSHIEGVSDSKYYDTLSSILTDKYQTVKSKLSLYKETTTKISELERTINTVKKEKTTLEQKLSSLPVLDGGKLFTDVNKANTKRGEEKQLSKRINEIKSEITKFENLIEDMAERKKKLEQLIKNAIKPEILSKKVKDVKNNLKQTENDLVEVTRKLAIGKQKQSMLEKNFSNIEKYHESSCFACGHKLSKDELGKWKASIIRNVSDLEKSKTNLEATINELEDSLISLQKEKDETAHYETELTAITGSIARHSYTINKELKVDLEKTEKDHKKVTSEIAKLSKNEDEYKKYQDRRDIEISLEEKESSITSINDRIEQLKKDVMDVSTLQNKVDFLVDMKRYINQRKEELLDVVRVKYNDMINQVYKDMKFIDIEEIIIQPDYTIRVIKKRGKHEITDFPLKALSASERITLGVILLIVTKREYLPTFPFFVIDEVVTSYDPSRFEKIKQYLKDVADYVLITELSAKGNEVDIVHET